MRAFTVLVVAAAVAAGCVASGPAGTQDDDLDGGEGADDNAGGDPATTGTGTTSPVGSDGADDGISDPDAGDGTDGHGGGNATGGDGSDGGGDHTGTTSGTSSTTSSTTSGTTTSTTSSATSTTTGSSTSSGTTSSGTTSSTTGAGQEPETRWLDVSATDNTDVFPSAGGLEIEVVDNGTWRPDLPSGGSAGPHPMGQHDVGTLHPGGFIVRLDGEEEGWCEVDFEVTTQMSNDVSADAWVDVLGTEVRVYGPAIPGHPDFNGAHVCPRS